MQKRIPIKNHHQEIQLIIQRSIVALVFISILIFLLMFRLLYLQIYKHDVYVTLSTQNWLDLVPIEPTRGLIYDRKGVLLAENIPVFSLDIIPFQTQDLNKTLTALRKIISLTDSDISQFKRQVKQHRRFEEIPLKLRLTEEEVARFAENQHKFSGVMIKARLMRHYPFNESFSHVIGYVGRINTKELDEIDQTNYSASHYIGKSGVESFYEEELHGTVGYQQVENDASGKSIRVLKDIKGIPGKNIYLTIDSSTQFVAEKALAGHRGAVVAIEPSTGQVLAMVSQPGFNPNPFVTGISQNEYTVLQSSADKPLYNRALRGLYPLASTIKPYLALEALNSGVTTQERCVNCQSKFQLRNHSHIYHDWQHHGGHGTVNVSKAIMSSCDIYFYDLALKMGIHRMDKILSEFGFGASTGIDLDDELTGIVASPEWKKKARHTHWYEGDTVISGIGQGYMQATPLQLAHAVATLANRGQGYMPYLLLGEQQLPEKNYTVQKPVPIDTITLSDPKHWDTVISAMQEVVASPHGTAYRFGRKHNYTIAAKTGTAQVVTKRGNPNEKDVDSNIPERFRDHHLFIAFAPVDHPKIALAIISENSNIAIETARAIFDFYIEGRLPPPPAPEDTPSKPKVTNNTTLASNTVQIPLRRKVENVNRDAKTETQKIAT